jgi:hypothetical protein
MDYRTSWEAWAGKVYDDPAVASAASSAAIAASSAGAGQWTAAIAAHRAAIRAGGEYVCRPDRAGLAIGICVVIFLLFVPATLAGLSVNPAPGGYVFLAGSIALPVLAVAGLVKVRRHSCFFVDRFYVGRRNWRGKVVASVAREGLAPVQVEMDEDSWSDLLLEGEPHEPAVRLGSSSVQSFWWSADRIRELATVAKP